jgi:hypothetical protein
LALINAELIDQTHQRHILAHSIMGNEQIHPHHPMSARRYAKRLWPFLPTLSRGRPLAHEFVIALLQSCLQGFQILVVVRQVGGLLLCEVLIPQSFFMVGLTMFKGLNEKPDSLR